MLETSKLIDGTQAKELDKMCEQYNDANAIIADNEKLKKQASNFIKSVCDELDTVYETSNYIVTMGHTGERETVDLKQIKAEYPEMYNFMLEKDLIKISENTLKLGSIKRKGKRV